jgi:hypothetical protein
MTERDPNKAAAKVVRQATEKHEKPLPADLEAAWAEWSKGIQKVDERAKTLLRAAFEAGWELGCNEQKPGAAALGRLGGLKGGKARAEKLSPAKRKAIAKKAAKARWERDQSDGSSE